MRETRQSAMKSTVGIMALLDTEEEYARLMTEFLRKHKNLPWELHTYTNAVELLREEKETVTLLVVAESACSEEIQRLFSRHMVVLSESGMMRWENLHYVDKYQQAEEVLKELLQVYMEIIDAPPPRLQKGCKTVFIGNYSPVRRAMQTSMALTLSQLLAREHPTLYLNFEHFAGIPELVSDMRTQDLAELLYFMDADKEKFRLRMQTVLKHIGDLDYVPPMKSGQNLLMVTAAEWMGLLTKIEELGEYEYVVLDLSESMQGLFQILRFCRKVFTVTREDKVACSKLLQYEQLLALYEYGDVLEKTRRLSLSHIRKLPEELEQLTKGDIASLAWELIREIQEGSSD